MPQLREAILARVECGHDQLRAFIDEELRKFAAQGGFGGNAGLVRLLAHGEADELRRLPDNDLHFVRMLAFLAQQESAIRLARRTLDEGPK